MNRLWLTGAATLLTAAAAVWATGRFGADGTQAAKARAVSTRPPRPQRLLSSRSGQSLVNPVVIDPGHGGSDPGTHGRNGVDEKTVTLAVARDLVPILKRDRIRFLLTRDRDQYVSLQRRVAIANTAHAALFVSLHCDEYSHHNMHGFTVIYAQGASADSRLAAKVIAGGLEHEHFFCHAVRAEVRHLYVLDNTVCPAVLVEMGFMSDPGDLHYLCSSKGRRRLAAGIARGIGAYLRRVREHQ